MSNASAKYVIQAQDQTKSTVESIKKGFEGLDKSARKLSMGFKALGIGAVAFKTWRIATQGAEAAIANLVATNADFAKSINETKAAYQNLWVAGDQAAAAQERLNAALGNPELLGATRRLAGADRIRGRLPMIAKCIPSDLGSARSRRSRKTPIGGGRVLLLCAAAARKAERDRHRRPGTAHPAASLCDA